MDPRGLTTLAVGAALMLSPFAIWLTSDSEPAAAVAMAQPDPPPASATDLAEAPAVAQTDAAAEPSCTAAAIISTSNRTDCHGQTTKVTTRRVTSGGAVFVQVGD